MHVCFIAVRTLSVSHETVVSGNVRCQQRSLLLGHSCNDLQCILRTILVTHPHKSVLTVLSLRINQIIYVSDSKCRKKTKSAIIIEDVATCYCQLSLQEMGEKQLYLNYNIIHVQLSSVVTISDKSSSLADVIQLLVYKLLPCPRKSCFCGGRHACRWSTLMTQPFFSPISLNFIDTLNSHTP